MMPSPARLATAERDAVVPGFGRILLQLDHARNQALLADVLTVRYQVVTASHPHALDEQFDLCIVDGPALDRLGEGVLLRRANEQPVFLPVLLVTSRAGVKMITRQVWRCVDELIISPIEPAELQARVEILLRARRLSLQLHWESELARDTAAALRERTGELERVTAQLEERTAAAEEANRAKSQFLTNMSHELRTPLNAIAGYSDLIQLGIRGPVTPQQKADLERIQASQRHLMGLINEVLNYAKLEAGSVHYELTEVDAREELEFAETIVQPQARAKGLTLVVEPCRDGLRVVADEEKLRQILANLLSNAVKFTPSGGTVRLSTSDDGDHVLFKVSDTGVGVDPDRLPEIFEPFVQIRSDLTKSGEGTGLGLAISRSIAEGMNGALWAESVPGEGSTFTLRLPAA
jgi:signal transduction histidine kinase